jgi:hypothetical protein
MNREHKTHKTPKAQTPQRHFPLIIGNSVYLALYRGGGISLGFITRHKTGPGGEILGFFIAEDANGETFLPLSRIGELAFATYQEAAAELARRKSEKGAVAI